MLVLLAIGLGGYALWRFVVAVLGEKVEHGEDVGVGKRLIYAARGVVYAGLCWTAISIERRRPQWCSTGQAASLS